MNLMTVFVIVAMLLVIASLAGGITSMVQDGEVGHHRSEQWMNLRVAFQALAVLLLLLSLFV